MNMGFNTVKNGSVFEGAPKNREAHEKRPSVIIKL